MPENVLTAEQARALALKLQALREQANLSQEDVAHAAGISRNHYQLMERGLSDRAHQRLMNPRLATLVALSGVFHTTVSDLVDIFHEGSDRPVVNVDDPRAARRAPGTRQPKG